MDEVFEALERLKNAPDFMGGTALLKDYELVKQTITELKQIKEADTSEAIRYLEVINDYGCGINDNMKFSEVFEKEYNTIKQTLLKAQDLKKFTKLVVEKKVDIKLIMWAGNMLEAYNQKVIEQKDYWWRDELTKDEFYFIKKMIAKYGGQNNE